MKVLIISALGPIKKHPINKTEANAKLILDNFFIPLSKPLTAVHM